MKIIRAICICGAILFSLAVESANAEQIQLSKRSVEQFKILQGHIADANQRLLLANILIAFAPFQPLLSPPDPVTAVEIMLTDWAPLAEASAHLGSFYRGELRKFCQLEAVSQNSSVKDYKFWLNLADSFDGKKTYFVGTWENRDGSDVVRAIFSETSSGLNASITGDFSGNQVSFPVSNIAVATPRIINFSINSGGENYRCEAIMLESKRSFSMSCKDPSGALEVTLFAKAG